MTFSDALDVVSHVVVAREPEKGPCVRSSVVKESGLFVDVFR